MVEKLVSLLLREKNSKKKDIIKFEVNKFENLIGIPITINEAHKIFTSLGFNCKKSKKDLKIEIPLGDQILTKMWI